MVSSDETADYNDSSDKLQQRVSPHSDVTVLQEIHDTKIHLPKPKGERRIPSVVAENELKYSGATACALKSDQEGSTYSLTPEKHLQRPGTLSRELQIKLSGSLPVSKASSTDDMKAAYLQLTRGKDEFHNNEDPESNTGRNKLRGIHIQGLGATWAVLLGGQAHWTVGLVATFISTSRIVVAGTFAFHGGKAFGSTPLTNRSPKKTWEGTIIGFCWCIVTAVVLSNIFSWPILLRYDAVSCGYHIGDVQHWCISQSYYC